MIKQLILIVAIFSLLSFSVNAHVLKRDESIGAIVHLDPDDDPVIGKPTAIYFEIKDTSGKFNFADCTCELVILQGDKELFRLPITNPNSNLYTPAASFVFPEAGSYDLLLVGKSITGLFSNFEIKSTTNVSRVAVAEPIVSNSGANDTQPLEEQSQSGLFVLPATFVLIAAIVVGLVIYKSGRTKAK